MNIFERAARMSLRFDSPVGFLTVEDLFSLPLESKTKVNLNSIAIEVHKKLKESADVSFVHPTVANTTDELRLEILKHIIESKIADKDRAVKAAETRSKLAELDNAIAQKKQAMLQDASLEDLEKQREALKGS